MPIVDNLKDARLAAQSSAASSIASRMRVYATPPAITPTYTAPAGQVASSSAGLVAMLGNVLWSLFWWLTIFCAGTYFCFWLSYVCQEWIDDTLYRFGLMWNPIQWPGAITGAHLRDILLGFALSVLGAVWRMIRLTSTLLFAAFRESYYLIKFLGGGAYGKLADGAAEITATHTQINNSPQAVLARQRFRRFRRALVVYSIPIAGLAFTALWLWDAAQPSVEPEVPRFYVPEWVIQSQPQNRPKEGSSHRSAYAPPIEWDAIPKPQRGWMSWFENSDDYVVPQADPFGPNYGGATDDFEVFEMDTPEFEGPAIHAFESQVSKSPASDLAESRTWTHGPAANFDEMESSTQRSRAGFEESQAARYDSAVKGPQSARQATNQQPILEKTTDSSLHKSHANNKRTTADLPGSLTSTNEPAAAAPFNAASPTSEDAASQLPSVDNRAPPTQNSFFKFLENYIPFATLGFNQQPSQTPITRRKQTPYRPSTSKPRSSAAQPLMQAAESVAVAAAHDQKRCVMGDKMVYCKTCGQQHCCELPY